MMREVDPHIDLKQAMQHLMQLDIVGRHKLIGD